MLRVHLDVCSHHVKHHATESQQSIYSRSTSTSLTQKLSRLCLEGQVEKTLQCKACIVERPDNRSELGIVVSDGALNGACDGSTRRT